MQRLGLLTLFIGALVLSSMDASPIYDNYNDNILSAASDSEESSIRDNSEESSVRDRPKRSFTSIHHYTFEVITHLWNGDGTPGPWRRQGCNAVYNCQTVSPHHCTMLQHFFCSNNRMAVPCTVDFHISVKANTSFKGIDLVLYKAKEPKPKNDFYLVFILASATSSSTVAKLAAYKVIEARCSGWQMFHLDHSTMADLINDEENDIHFELLVAKNYDGILPCETVHSMFLLTTDAHIVMAPSENSTTTPKEGSGDYLTDESTTPSNETSSATTEAATKAKITNPFSLPDDGLLYHVPILNMFVKKFSKRNADTSKYYNTRTEKRWCQLTENVVNLDSTIQINNDTYTVIAPKVYNVGECRVSTKESDGVKEKDCLPRRLRPLELVVSRWTGGKQFVFIHESPEVMVIEDCG